MPKQRPTATKFWYIREFERDFSRLEHILAAIACIEDYTNGIGEDDMRNDRLHLHATIYNVQIIGEAVYKLTREFKTHHPETPWAVIEKMRHILIHDYIRINFEVLWDVVTKDIPLLKLQIKQYLSEAE